jgi:hypothetical protein
MKKIILFLVITLCSLSQSFGQFKMPKTEDFELAEKLPIVILKKKENDQNGVEFNKYVKKYVEQFFGTERIHAYLTYNDFKKFIKKKGDKDKFIFVGYDYVNSQKSFNNGVQIAGIDYLNYHNIYLGICGRSYMINNGYLAVMSYQEFPSKLFEKKNKFIIDESLMKFAISNIKQQLENGINQKEDLKSNENLKNIKELTLLIDKNIVDEKFLDDLKKNYVYKYEIVDSERIKKAILENENGVAFFHNHFQPMASRQFANLLHIYQANDLKILYFTLPENVGKFQIGKPKLIVDDKKDYIEMLINEIAK